MIDWWRGIDWMQWIDEIGVVERPTEDAAIRRIALQSARALSHMQQVRAMIFRDLVREVLIEEREKRTDWTLRQVHAARGVELQWRETTTRRGNTFVEVIEVALPKSA